LQSASEPSKLIVADGKLAHAEESAAFLGRHGYETRAVDDGGDAILAAETWPADGAIISLPLASIPGLEVARHLRQSFGPSFRLVAFAPGADGAALRPLLHAGFDQVVASAGPESILAALGEATRVLVERSMQQAVRRIELLVVLGHSLLGPRQRPASAANVERVCRIVKLVERDIAQLAKPKDRERLTRELKALAERVPDPRLTQF
jgi:CheY-like chemotaxis protein